VITDDGVQPATEFNEYRVLGTYRQPRIFGTTDFVASGFVEQGARTSFDFNRRGARAELARRLGPRWSLSARYALDRTEVFNETFSEEDALLIDRLFPQVRLSSVSSSLIRDTRDDPLGPSQGTLVGIDNEVAGRAIGSEVGFVKSFVQGFAFRRLRGPRGVILAAGVRLGLAAGFAREVPEVDADGAPCCDRTVHPCWRASTTCRQASGSLPAAIPRSAGSGSTSWAPRSRSMQMGFREAATRWWC
jgi:hypothetical protein